MSDDAAAGLTLAGLAAALCAIVWLQVREAGSVSIWVVTRLVRMYCLLMLSQRVHGRCPLPVEGGALLISNHRSPTDPMLLYCASLLKTGGYRTRVLEYLAAGEYCSLAGPMGWITRTSRVIPVQRNGKDTASAKEALRRLQAGRIVAIFPEGGIHRGPGLREFNSGIAWLALRGRVPVIPAVVRNSPYREPLLLSFLMRQPADVLFGPPVDLSRWHDLKPTPPILEEVTQHLRGVLEGMLAGSCAPGPTEDCTPRGGDAAAPARAVILPTSTSRRTAS
jgi:1-acyl-sn-glycerol-3-phosphate acyltransferase